MTKEQWINRCNDLFETYNSFGQTKTSVIVTEQYLNELNKLYEYTQPIEPTSSNLKKYLYIQELWNQLI